MGLPTADATCPRCFHKGSVHVQQVIRGTRVIRGFRCTACEYEWEAALGLAFINDWNMAARAGVNVLVLGADDTITALVNASRQDLTEPVMTRRGTGRLALPSASTVATLVLLDVLNLAPTDQQRLWMWLNHEHPRIISTARPSILSMLKEGRFLESLYYRLNTVCIDASIVIPRL